jgi:hypothetical protein
MIKLIYRFKNLDYQKILLILGLIISLTSIGFSPDKLVIFSQLKSLKYNLYLNYSTYGIMYLLDICRGTITIIYFPIILFFFFKFYKNNKIIFKSNIFFFTFFIYLITQFVSFFINENLPLESHYNNPLNTYYLINSINILLTFHLALKKFSKENFKIFFLILLLFLSVFFLFFIIQYIDEFLKVPALRLYHAWGGIDQNFQNYSSSEVPRPTGLSRIALIILIAINSYDLFKKNYPLLVKTLIILLATIVILLGARAPIIILFLYILFYFVLNRQKINLFNFLNVMIILPLILFFLINFIKFNFVTENTHFLENIKNLNKQPLKIDVLSSEYAYRNHMEGVLLSGRLEDWKEILSKNKRLLFGYGVQGDRALINQTASNGLLYAFASGGIFSLFFMFAFSLTSFYYSIVNLQRAHKILWYQVISAYLIGVFLLRSIIETSYGVFGFDLIIFVLCSLTLEYSIKKDK